jgi:hypothetical protein
VWVWVAEVEQLGTDLGEPPGESAVDAGQCICRSTVCIRRICRRDLGLAEVGCLFPPCGPLNLYSRGSFGKDPTLCASNRLGG